MLENDIGAEKLVDVPSPTLETSFLKFISISVHIAALGARDTLAEDVEEEETTQKTGWAVRLEIVNETKFDEDGVPKTCLSIKISIEHPEDILACQETAMTPMANGLQNANNALVQFTSQLMQTHCKVRNFIEKANEVLPFKYLVVASILVDNSNSTIQWLFMFMLRIALVYIYLSD